MGLRLIPLPGDPSTVSIVYGPVVLAGELGTVGMTDSMRQGYSFPNIDRLFTDGAAWRTPTLVPPAGDPREWILPVSGRPLVFETRGAGKPQDLTLIPFYRLFGERYALYFRTWTPGEWERHTAARSDLPPGIVDSVRVGDPRSEDEHNFQAWRYARGEFAGTPWITSSQWLRYDMDLPRDSGGKIRLTIAASDTVTFDVLLDGLPCATVSLRSPSAGGLRCIDVPFERATVAARPRVAVLVRGKAGTPHLSGCTIIRAE
jgi:hypothetical protein